MPALVPDEIERYAVAHTTVPPPLFAQLAEETQERTSAPGMMSGVTVGSLLQLLIVALDARRVLEVGTFTGYSALMMASALPEDGQLITCDVDEENTAIARRYWARSPHGARIELKLGPALATMARLEGPFDLIFIDADKENYPRYYKRAFELLAPRGLIVADNVLWSGKILAPEDESGRAIAEFNEAVQRDARVQNVLLTVRDGLMLIRRIDA